MKGEYGKFYLLNPDKFYFSVDLQRKIKFNGKVAVKCSSGYGETGHFGFLVNTEEKIGPDYETNNEIEFEDEDIIKEYTLKDMPLLYNDFSKK